ncbi:MAG: hypothetical protein HZB38_02930 [Planctomycetes bacterium]|nr:hypothetical protein [Planctomycetota bacterium]
MLLNALAGSLLILFNLWLPQQPPTPEGARTGRQLPPHVRDPQNPEAMPRTASAPAPTGPMRVEPFGIQDIRIAFIGGAPEGARGPTTRFLFKLTGEKVASVDRAGKLIIEQMADDTGADLLDPKAYTDRDRTGTNPVSPSANVAQNGFLALDYACNTPPTRAAKKVAKVKGYVNIVYGGPSEEITIDNPMQYAGRTVENPRLKELGIEVRVLKPGEEAIEPADGRGLALRIEKGEDSVKNIDIYDDWMKRMNVRPRVSKTAKDEVYFYYQVMGGIVTNDHQLVLTVYKSIEKQKVPFEASDIELP